MLRTTDLITLTDDKLFSPDGPVKNALKYAEWKLRFARASAAESPMRELVGLCASIADGAAFLLDGSQKISFFGGSSRTSSALASALLASGSTEGTDLEKMLAKAPGEKLVYDYLPEGDICWGLKISLEQTEDFYMVLFTGGKRSKEEISVLFGMLVESFTEINLMRQRGSLPLGDFRAFLNAVTSGALSEWDEIDAYAKRLPSPPRKYMTIAVAQASPMGRTSVESLISRLRAFFPGCSAARLGDQIVLMISAPTREFQPKPVFSEKEMHALLTQYDGYIAFSNVTQRLDMIRTNYLLAESTLRLGKAIQERGGSRIFYYEDYAEYIAIELSLERYREIMHHDDLLFLTNPDAVTLYRWDHHNGTDLQTVLYYFCKNNGNISAAAQEAFMHRNTFSARMAQIREILGDTDLSDGRVQHRMLFSCRVFRYYNLYYDKNAPRSLSERLSLTEGA